MQKIVQLPFQIPTWMEPDISKSIKKIITSGLKDTTLVAEFDNNETLNLIVNAVQLNPREVKTVY